jgi:hypothetical protein
MSNAIRSISFLVMALTAAWGLGACGSSDSGQATGGAGGAATGGQSGGGSGGGTQLACDDDGDIDLDGIFALAAKFSFTFGSQPGGAVTICPADQTSEGSFLGLVRLTHQAGSTQIASAEAVVCTLQLPIISAGVGECDPGTTNLVYAGLEFPQALIDACPLATLTSLQPGATFDLQRLTFTIGTDKTGDEMPTWLMDKTGCGMSNLAAGRTALCDPECVSDCAGLVDDDHDGWPGVTVHVCGLTEDDKQQKVPCNAEEPNVPGATIQGRAMLDLQVDPQLKGAAVSSCEVSGNLDAAIRYNVVGADLYVLSQISVTSAIKSLPVYTVNPSESRFRLARIDGKHGSADWAPDFGDVLSSCKTVIARQNELR